MPVRAWIQELFLRILNLESRKICKRLQIFGIQDSRFWGKVLESKPLDLGVLDASQGLDSRTSPQNLASWIQENLQTFAIFWDSRFKVLRKSSWIQALRSWGSGCQSGLGFKNFSSESCILNLGSRKICKRLQFFWDSRFKIQDNFWGFNVCVCTWVFTWLLEFYYIYIYIWHPPEVNQNMTQNCKQKYKLKMCIIFCKYQ